MKPGLLIRLWRWLFWDPPPLHPISREQEPQDGDPRCAQRCLFEALSDPRCEAGNCTQCCRYYCPAHRCGKQGAQPSIRYVTESTATLSDLAAIFRSVPEVASILTCPCGQKNRVKHADFGRGPVCGACKRALRLPS